MSHALYSALFPTVLDASVLASVGVLLLHRPKRIQLPTSDTDPPARSVSEDAVNDPFDIATFEEVSDGSPIDEDEFWAKVRGIKMMQTGVLALGVAIACGRLGWLFWDKFDPRNNFAIFSSVSLVVFHVYLLVVSAYSIGLTDTLAHWSLVVHISALSAIGFLASFINHILPAGPRLETSSLDTPAVGDILNWLVIIELATTAIIASTIPRAPKLYFPPELVYQLSTLGTSAPKGRHNVIGEPHASVISFLMFNFVTPVAMLGYNQTEPMEISDLPILTAWLRSPYIFSRMRKVINSAKLSTWWHAKLGSGFELIYQLLVVNKRAFIIQAFLSVGIAGLYYVPAWFLQQFVHFLELTRNPAEPHDIDPGWGWVYCAGLFLSSITVPLVAAQLWSVSVTRLQIPLKIQLNTMLFAKTLVRKDIASTASTSASKVQTRAATPVDGNASSDSQETVGKGTDTPASEDEFSSKAQVHTLMTTDVDRVSGFHIHFYPRIAIGMFFLYTLLGVSCFLGLGVAIILIPVNHYGSKYVTSSQDNLMKARDERVALMNECVQRSGGTS
ncbi:hypothetical protein BDV93DRAFT_564656 [Ceratobasidium sp. AG-I]|nr:hypothetical protein BDV93DRAFT_564656 [Ceratobasidium sp. AG-I]